MNLLQKFIPLFCSVLLIKCDKSLSKEKENIAAEQNKTIIANDDDSESKRHLTQPTADAKLENGSENPVILGRSNDGNYEQKVRGESFVYDLYRPRKLKYEEYYTEDYTESSNRNFGDYTTQNYDLNKQPGHNYEQNKKNDYDAQNEDEYPEVHDGYKDVAEYGAYKQDENNYGGAKVSLILNNVNGDHQNRLTELFHDIRKHKPSYKQGNQDFAYGKFKQEEQFEPADSTFEDQTSTEGEDEPYELPVYNEPTLQPQVQLQQANFHEKEQKPQINQLYPAEGSTPVEFSNEAYKELMLHIGTSYKVKKPDFKGNPHEVTQNNADSKGNGYKSDHADNFGLGQYGNGGNYEHGKREYQGHIQQDKSSHRHKNNENIAQANVYLQNTYNEPNRNVNEQANSGEDFDRQNNAKPDSYRQYHRNDQHTFRADSHNYQNVVENFQEQDRYAHNVNNKNPIRQTAPHSHESSDGSIQNRDHDSRQHPYIKDFQRPASEQDQYRPLQVYGLKQNVLKLDGSNRRPFDQDSFRPNIIHENRYDQIKKQRNPQRQSNVGSSIHRGHFHRPESQKLFQNAPKRHSYMEEKPYSQLISNDYGSKPDRDRNIQRPHRQLPYREDKFKERLENQRKHSGPQKTSYNRNRHQINRPNVQNPYQRLIQHLRQQFRPIPPHPTTIPGYFRPIPNRYEDYPIEEHHNRRPAKPYNDPNPYRNHKPQEQFRPINPSNAISFENPQHNPVYDNDRRRHHGNNGLPSFYKGHVDVDNYEQHDESKKHQQLHSIPLCIGLSDGTLLGEPATNCKSFFVCKRGESLKLSCPNGKILDARFGACAPDKHAKCSHKPVLPLSKDDA